MSGVATFFLRLAGLAPEQKKVQKEFDKQLEKLDDADHRLDDILKGIERVNTQASERRKALGKTIASFPPDDAPTKPFRRR